MITVIMNISSSAHPGLVPVMGDVDGSGVIDKEDMNALVVLLMRANITGMDEEGMDLNRDGPGGSATAT